MSIFFIGIVMLFACGFLASMFDNQKKTRVLSILSLIGAVFCSIPAINVLLNKNILSFKFFLNDFTDEMIEKVVPKKTEFGKSEYVTDYTCVKKVS